MNGDGVTTGEVHWSAVIAGVIVSLVGQVLLTLLGAGLGAASFDAAQGQATGETIAWGAYVWWAVTGIACAFAGGWTAGWVAGSADRVDRVEGSFQAFLSWATATLIVATVVFGLATGSVLSTRLGGPLALPETTVERAAEGSPAAQQEVADATAKGTLWSFFVLIIGAIVAVGGGYFGVRHAKQVMSSDTGMRVRTDGASARTGPMVT